jgi:hypothetical protein
MKRIIVSITLIVAFSLTGFSQNDLDALRYSQSFIGGTARSMSMGGAFGALGGDFTSLSINPAGVGMYRAKEFSITPTFYHDMTTSTFLGKQIEDTRYNLNLNNVGIVFSLPLRESSNWKFLNIGVGFNALDNYHQDVVMEGVNHNSSLLDYFVWDGTGYYNDELDLFGSGLAWDTWLISESDTTGLNYGSVLNDYGNRGYLFGQNQKRVIRTTGTKGEYLVSLGTNYNDKLYIGASIGFTRIDFYQEVTHIEEDLSGTVPDLDNFYYYYRLKTQGTGFTFKLGATYRPVSFLRIGAAVHLPTFYKMDDDFYSYMEANYDTPRPYDTLGYLTYSAESPDGYNEYELNTPFKFIGSAAVQIQKFAIISFDYEYINYSKAQLKGGSDGSNFTTENEVIDAAYRPASNIRLGTEFKLGMFSLRGGYAYYGKPYAGNELNENSAFSFITGGIGIRTKAFFLDLGYQYGLHEEKYLMYTMEELDETTLNSHHNKLMATFGYRF